MWESENPSPSQREPTFEIEHMCYNHGIMKVDKREVAGIMANDSTGGASRGSEYPPVIFSEGLSEFIAQLAALNVVFDDLPSAMRLFRAFTVGRILPYVEFLKRSRDGGGVAFASDIAAVVGFDRELQGVLMQAIGTIETQAKTQFINLMTACYGEYCLYDSRNFISIRLHQSTMARLERGLPRRAKRSSSGRLASSAQECEPCSKLIDSSTLGMFSRLLGNTADAEVLSKVASTFGVDLHRFVSWMRLLTSVRNACAHFDKYCVKRQIPCVPRSVEGARDDPTRPLYVLLVIEEMLTGRQRVMGSSADGALVDFMWGAREAVVALEQHRPHLIDMLSVPEAFRRRRLRRAGLRGAFPVLLQSRSPKAANYEVVALAA